MTQPESFLDQLKRAYDDLEIDRHLTEAADQLESAFVSARSMVATLAAERGDEVEDFLDKASSSIDERTDGRYAEQVGKVREGVSGVVAKLAEYRPASAPVEEIETPPAE
ncbi:antitoxin [Nocardioides currus]|nr:antitoxin [Nocardioides currus]